ncbi:hypothetical protein M885DRAFT_113900 [Pelagophyceae sp. CCMP2097]|nr:hypothetical protein M885DRAFT_113900 [Pelagophyceae sp. CCMP2097]
MVRCLNILVLLVAGAVAFTALASVSAAMPANAFAAEYLPAILVPVMTLFLPVIGMTMSWILVDKNEI